VRAKQRSFSFVAFLDLRWARHRLVVIAHSRFL
jgi:hypothetical protein